ncbi:MAG: glycosyltransferase family 39 protein [Pseudomonadota bacterium]|nr:glycosyltransferase family 39 protein [Pseudomonadota bacterium]
MRAGHVGGRHKPMAVLALILLALVATAWLRPLMLPDEGRYVGVAWEMMHSGDWLTPTLNGLPFFHKPPLFYWITAASMSLFGLHEWAGRLASVTGAALGAFSLWWFLRRWWGERAADLTAVALLAQPLYFLGGQFANLDMLVAGCITATIVLGADAALSIDAGRPWRVALAGAWATAALGVLAKGLIGIVIPGGTLLLWLLLLRRWRLMGQLLWWPGLLLFAVIAVPWFWAMQQRFPDFLHYFFVVQHFQRFAAGGFNNVWPVWFYPAVLLLASLPWLPWLMGNRKQPTAAAATADTNGRLVALLMACWFGLVLLFFSIPASKLVGYIFPAVPPLAALMARGFTLWGAAESRKRKAWLLSLAATVVLNLAVVIGIALQQRDSLRKLGGTLAALHTPDAPVLMLGKYYYDLPFYARLQAPVAVFDDWQYAAANPRDDWHSELIDAGRFAPARAQAALLMPDALPLSLCKTVGAWVVGPVGSVATYPVLRLVPVVASQRDIRLWNIDASRPDVFKALRCAGTPSVDPASR